MSREQIFRRTRARRVNAWLFLAADALADCRAPKAEPPTLDELLKRVRSATSIADLQAVAETRLTAELAPDLPTIHRAIDRRRADLEANTKALVERLKKNPQSLLETWIRPWTNTMGAS
jgi:hypothetical protein